MRESVRFGLFATAGPELAVAGDRIDAGLDGIGYSRSRASELGGARDPARSRWSASYRCDGMELVVAVARPPGGALQAWIGLSAGGLRRLFEAREEGRYFAAVGLAAEAIGAVAGLGRLEARPEPPSMSRLDPCLRSIAAPAAIPAPLAVALRSCDSAPGWRRQVEERFTVTPLTADHLLLVERELERDLVAARSPGSRLPAVARSVPDAPNSEETSRIPAFPAPEPDRRAASGGRIRSGRRGVPC